MNKNKQVFEPYFKIKPIAMINPKTNISLSANSISWKKNVQLFFVPSSILNQNRGLLSALFVCLGLFCFSACCIDGDCDDDPMEDDPTTTIHAINKCGELTESEVWIDQGTGVDYIVDCDLIVRDVTLRIREGVTIQLENDAIIKVLGDGVLDANGEQLSKIIFQGSEEEDYTWSGIFIESRNNQTRFDNVEIKGAGSKNFEGLDFPEGRAALKVTGALRMTNSTIHHINGHGIHIGPSSAAESQLRIDQFKENTIQNCQGHPMIMLANKFKLFSEFETCLFEDNLEQSIGLVVNPYDNYFSEAVLFSDPGIPLMIYNSIELDKDGRLTIEEGTEVIFKSGAWMGFVDIQSNEDSYIRMLGTSARKIVLRGESSDRGAWGGIHFNSPSMNNLMQYVEIWDAGYNYFETMVAIDLHNPWIGANLSMENVVIRNSDCGIRMGGGATLNASLGDVIYQSVDSETCD